MQSLISGAERLFEDWYLFFIGRGDDKKLAWFSGLLLVTFPILAGIYSIEVTVSIALHREPLLARVNRSFHFFVSFPVCLVIAGLLTNKLRYDGDVATKLAARPKPSRSRILGIFVAWYVAPLSVFIALLVVA